MAALLASRVGIPAAWLVMPLIVALLAALVPGRHTPIPTVPTPAYLAAQAIVGVAASASFRPATLAVLTQQWLAVVVLVGSVMLLSLVSGTLMVRLAPLQATTALLGALPGGAPAMVASSDDMHADARLVACMQYLRLLVIVFSTTLLMHLVGQTGEQTTTAAPIAALADGVAGICTWRGYGITTAIATVGGWAGLRAGVPAGAMLGPALLGAAAGGAGIAHGCMPPGTFPLASAVIGVAVGLRFTPATLRQVGQLAVPMLLAALFLVAGAAGLGWLFALATGMDALTAYLAALPGGIQIATIIALESGVNSAFVITVHLVRFLLIVLTGPHLVRLLVRRLATTAHHQTAETAADSHPSTPPHPAQSPKSRR